MFRISEEEIKKFKEYERIANLNREGLIDDEALSGNLAFAQLQQHQVAYSLAYNLLQEKIDLNKPSHQSMLGLALQVQKNPETWSKLKPAEQMTLLHLYSAKLDDEQFQYHINEVCSELLDLGLSFVKVPLVGFAAKATKLTLNKFVPGNEIGRDILQHLHKDLFEDENLAKLLDKKFKLSASGLQYILAKIHGQPKKEDLAKKIAQEISERKEEKQEEKQAPSVTQEINLTQVFAPVFNEEITPLVTELVNAWTSESLEGFESEESVIRLNDQLIALKQNKASPKAILEKAAELKNQKVMIIRERIQFDKKVENIGHVVSSASSVASLFFNNPRLGREIAVIGSSALKAGQIVAGLCGFGALAAGINPLAAASTLLDCTTQIAGLFSGGQDASQLILSGIFELKQQIENLREEMHARFDEVMRGLNYLEQQQLRHFCEMKRDNESILNSLKLVRRDQEQYHLETGGQLKQIIQSFDDLSRNLKNQRKRDALRTILGDVRKQIEEKKLNTHAYESARATLINFVETLGSGATHEDLTGAAVKPDDFHSLDSVLDESSPEFNLNTLAQHFSKYHAEGLAPYTPDLMKRMLGKILGTNMDFSLAEVVNIKHLFNSQPKNIKIDSLLLTLDQFKSTSAPILIVPIQINARWNLLVIHKKAATAVLFACSMHQDVVNRINEILIISGINKDKMSTHMLPIEITPNLSGIWLVEAVKIIIAKCKDEIQVKALTTIKINSAQFNSQLREHKLEVDTVSATLPNPRVLRFLCYQLLQLTYSQYPKLGAESFPINPCEAEGVQASLDQSEAVYQFYTQCFDKSFFDKLINDYKASLHNIFSVIQKRAEDFGKTLSDELNTKAKELSRAAYFSDRDVQRFKQEEIPINAYGGWFNRKGGGYVYQRNFFDSRHNQSHSRPYDAFGSDTTYYSAQKKQIASFRDTVMKSRQLEFDSHKLANKYCVSSYYSQDFKELKDIDLPPLIFPQDMKADLPILPAPKDLFSYLSDDAKKLVIEAQSLCLGCINYTYEIVSGNFCININFEFYRGEYKGNVPITQLATKYNPIFYTGKEAAWWFWSGGEIPVAEASARINVYTDSSTHNHFDHYATVPTKVVKKGLIYVNANKEEHSLELKQSQPENITELNIETGDEYYRLRKKFYDQITRECERSVSELGQAVTRLNAQYKLLYLYTQFLFPFACNDVNSPIYNYFNKFSGIKNKLDLLAALQRTGTWSCIGYFVYNPDIDKLHTEINSLIDMIANSARLKALDETQMHLLSTLDDLVPNLNAGPSITDKAKFYETMSAMEGRALAMLSTMSLDDFAKAQVKLKQALTVRTEVETKFVQGERLDLGLLQPLQNLLTVSSAAEEKKEPAKPISATSAGLWAGKKQLHSQSELEFKVTARM